MLQQRFTAAPDFNLCMRQAEEESELTVNLSSLQRSADRMPRYQEAESGPALVAKRYSILQSLGRGSFGSVYLVQDIRATDGEQL